MLINTLKIISFTTLVMLLLACSLDVPTQTKKTSHTMMNSVNFLERCSQKSTLAEQVSCYKKLDIKSRSYFNNSEYPAIRCFGLETDKQKIECLERNPISPKMLKVALDELDTIEKQTENSSTD